MMVFNVGDSHTFAGSWCRRQEDHYWYKLSTSMGYVDIVNESKPGRSNDMMFKLIIKHCLENPQLPTYYIINITTIFRIDLCYPTSATLHQVLKPEAVADLDFETIECTLYSHLIGTLELLKARGKQFIVVNNGKNFSNAPLPIRDAYVNYIKQEPRVLNWFEDARVNFQENITQIKPLDFAHYGWNGHDGVEAHAKYYEMLQSRLSNI
jgi:hypothetical protein